MPLPRARPRSVARAGEAGSRAAPRPRYSRLLFTCVVHGAGDEESRQQYASKIADNVPRLLARYPAASAAFRSIAGAGPA